MEGETPFEEPLLHSEGAGRLDRREALIQASEASGSRNETTSLRVEP
jgi:hypothetical protein